MAFSINTDAATGPTIDVPGMRSPFTGQQTQRTPGFHRPIPAVDGTLPTSPVAQPGHFSGAAESRHPGHKS